MCRYQNVAKHCALNVCRIYHKTTMIGYAQSRLDMQRRRVCRELIFLEILNLLMQAGFTDGSSLANV